MKHDEILQNLGKQYTEGLGTKWFLGWNNPVNSHHTKLDKSKLVWNNPVNSRHTKLDKSKLVWNNPVNSCHTKLVKFQLVWNNPVYSYLQYTYFTSWWNTRQVYTCLDNPVKSLPFSHCFSYYFLYFFSHLFSIIFISFLFLNMFWLVLLSLKAFWCNLIRSYQVLSNMT